MNTVPNKISATKPLTFVSIEDITKITGYSDSHTRKQLREIKILAGLNVKAHKIHIDTLLLYCANFSTFAGLKRENFLRTNWYETI